MYQLITNENGKLSEQVLNLLIQLYSWVITTMVYYGHAKKIKK